MSTFRSGSCQLTGFTAVSQLAERTLTILVHNWALVDCTAGTLIVSVLYSCILSTYSKAMKEPKDRKEERKKGGKKKEQERREEKKGGIQLILCSCYLSCYDFFLRMNIKIGLFFVFSSFIFETLHFFLPHTYLSPLSFLPLFLPSLLLPHFAVPVPVPLPSSLTIYFSFSLKTQLTCVVRSLESSKERDF